MVQLNSNCSKGGVVVVGGDLSSSSLGPKLLCAFAFLFNYGGLEC